MTEKEINEINELNTNLNDIDDLCLCLEVASKKSVMIIQELVDTIIQLEQENAKLKELKYKFLDDCDEEESFTLNEYLELSNRVYDLEEENQKLIGEK